MSDRKEGWYWVRDDVEGWHPVQWIGRWCSPFVIQHGGLSDSDYLEIGPRIPSPDEPWQTVPVEPTAKMREAFHNADLLFERGMVEHLDSHWRMMLQASPKPGDES